MSRLSTAIRRLVSRFVSWFQGEVDAAVKQGFRVLAAVAALLLLYAFLRELLVKASPDAKAVGTLFACLLAAAFVAAYGKEIASRVKKIGPVEFIEVQRAILSLQEEMSQINQELEGHKLIAGGVSPTLGGLSLTPVTLSPAQRFHYEEGDRLLAFLRFSGSEPKEGSEAKVYFELLFNVGQAAHLRVELLRAIRWLERLEEVSGGTHRPHEARNLIAFSKLFYALREAEARDWREKIEDAVDRFERLAGSKKLIDAGYFWLAYARDELGVYYEAVQAYQEVLARNPRLAPARFNMAISLLKLGRDREALRCLAEIQPSHDQFDRVRRGAREDPEMKELVDKVGDPKDRRLLQRTLRKLGDA